MALKQTTPDSDFDNEDPTSLKQEIDVAFNPLTASSLAELP